MDPVTLDRLAIASTRLRVADLREGDLSRPTVNAGWDVRALVAHLVGGCLLYAGVLRGGTVEWATRDTRPVTDPLGQFDAAAARLNEAITRLRPARRCRPPRPPVPDFSPRRTPPTWRVFMPPPRPM